MELQWLRFSSDAVQCKRRARGRKYFLGDRGSVAPGWRAADERYRNHKTSRRQRRLVATRLANAYRKPSSKKGKEGRSDCALLTWGAIYGLGRAPPNERDNNTNQSRRQTKSNR